MNYKICGNESHKLFSSMVIQKYDVSYFYCENCGFLQIEELYWLRKAYQEPINTFDTGLVFRNLYFSKAACVIIYVLFKKDAKFLDFAGGCGLFIRLMRDTGFDFYWYDLFSRNIFARGFEHFSEPVTELKNIFAFSKNLLFSTNILPYPVPQANDWEYYDPWHAQHISFYSKSTLRYIADIFGLNIYSHGNIHLFTDIGINEIYFKILVKFHRMIYFLMISGKLKSKTYQDMRFLLHKNNLD